ncbi:MAG: ribosome assembly RNA-binding protein YhbY [Pseudomonadota bacterium]
MPLTQTQKRALRGQAHALRPVVILGQRGLTDNVLEEVGIALGAHELIKVRINAGDREERDALMNEISRRTGATLVQRIGHVAVFFRRNPDKPRIVLPE